MRILTFTPPHVLAVNGEDPLQLVVKAIEKGGDGKDIEFTDARASDREYTDLAVKSWEDLNGVFDTMEGTFDAVLIPFDASVMQNGEEKARAADMMQLFRFARSKKTPHVILYIEEGNNDVSLNIEQAALDAGIVHIHSSEKPLSQLVARMKNAANAPVTAKQSITIGPVTISTATGHMMVTKDGVNHDVHLTRKERDVIAAIARRGQSTTEVIYNSLYGLQLEESEALNTEKIIDVFITKIRKKISEFFPEITDSKGKPNLGFHILLTYHGGEKRLATDRELRHSCPSLFPEQGRIVQMGTLALEFLADGSAKLKDKDYQVLLNDRETQLIRAAYERRFEWTPRSIYASKIFPQDEHGERRVTDLIRSLEIKMKPPSAEVFSNFVGDQYGNVYFLPDKNDGTRMPKVLNMEQYKEVLSLDGICVMERKDEYKSIQFFADIIGPHNRVVPISEEQLAVLKYVMNKSNRNRWIDVDTIDADSIGINSRQVAYQHIPNLLDRLSEAGIDTGSRFIRHGGGLWVIDGEAPNMPLNNRAIERKLERMPVVEKVDMGGWFDLHLLRDSSSYIPGKDGQKYYLNPSSTELIRHCFSSGDGGLINAPIRGEIRDALANQLITDSRDLKTRCDALQARMRTVCVALENAGFADAFRSRTSVHWGTTFFSKEAREDLVNPKTAWKYAIERSREAGGWGTLHILDDGKGIFERREDGSEPVELPQRLAKIFEHMILNPGSFVIPERDGEEFVTRAKDRARTLLNDLSTLKSKLGASSNGPLAQAFHTENGLGLMFIPSAESGRRDQYIRQALERHVA